MTIEQTVEIRADHRLVMELPLEVPIGRARVEVIVTPESSSLAEKNRAGKAAISLLDLRGSCKGDDTLDAYFERKQVDKIREDANDFRLRASN
jgi:hypothetical protein